MDVRLKNGDILEFPDDAPGSAIAKYISSNYPSEFADESPQIEPEPESSYRAGSPQKAALSYLNDAVMSPADTLLRGAKGAIGIGQTVMGAANMLASPAQDLIMHDMLGFESVGEARKDSPYRPEEAKAFFDDQLSDEHKRQRDAFRDADWSEKLTAAAENPQAVMGEIVESILPMLGSMGMAKSVAASIYTKAATEAGAVVNATGQVVGSAAAKAAGAAAVKAAEGTLMAVGAATEGGITAGQIAEEAQGKGKEWGDYAPEAAGAGLVTTAIGYGSGKLFGDIATDLATGTNTMRGGLLGKVFKSTATEGPIEEGGQSASETMFTNSIYDPEHLTKGVADAYVSGSIVGGVMGAAMGGGSHIMNDPYAPVDRPESTELNLGNDIQPGTELNLGNNLSVQTAEDVAVGGIGQRIDDYLNPASVVNPVNQIADTGSIDEAIGAFNATIGSVELPAVKEPAPIVVTEESKPSTYPTKLDDSQDSFDFINTTLSNGSILKGRALFHANSQTTILSKDQKDYADTLLAAQEAQLLEQQALSNDTTNIIGTTGNDATSLASTGNVQQGLDATSSALGIIETTDDTQNDNITADTTPTELEAVDEDFETAAFDEFQASLDAKAAEDTLSTLADESGTTSLAQVQDAPVFTHTLGIYWNNEPVYESKDGQDWIDAEKNTYPKDENTDAEPLSPVAASITETSTTAGRSDTGLRAGLNNEQETQQAESTAKVEATGAEAGLAPITDSKGNTEFTAGRVKTIFGNTKQFADITPETHEAVKVEGSDTLYNIIPKVASDSTTAETPTVLPNSSTDTGGNAAPVDSGTGQSDVLAQGEEEQIALFTDYTAATKKQKSLGNDYSINKVDGGWTVTESALSKALKKAGIDSNKPLNKANKLRKEAEKIAKEAHAMLDRIPPGQPVSSTRDANLREKSREKMAKAAELYKQADELDGQSATAPDGAQPSPITNAAENTAVSNTEAITKPRLKSDRQALADKVSEGIDYAKMPSVGSVNRLYQSFNEGVIILRSGTGSYSDDKQYNAVYQSVLKTKAKILEHQESTVSKNWEDSLTQLNELSGKQETTPVPKPKKRNTSINDSDTLLTAIAKLGGISRASAQSEGIDPAYFNKRSGGVLPIFRKEGGKSFDSMAEALQEYGYDVTDGEGRYSGNVLLEKVSSSLNQDEKHYTATGNEQVAEIAQQEQYREEAARHSFELENLLSQTQEHDPESVAAITQKIEQGKITPENINEYWSELNDFIADRNNASVEVGAQEVQGAELELTGQTNDEINAAEREQKQRAEQERKAKRLAEQKAEVDRNNGSEVDEMLGNGKTDSLFDEPLFSKSAPTEIKANKSVVDENGVHFETGVPVTFTYAHNTESATKLFGKPNKNSEFGRGYEPSGQYLSIIGKAPAEQRKGMVYGSVTFNNPLVIENDGLNWKQQLSESFGGKTGKQLSQAIIDAGYDGVVTTDGKYTSETLNLTNFDKSKAKYSKSPTSINPHNKASLTGAIRAALDSKFGAGWFNRLLGTGKFKIINAAEAEQILSGDTSNFESPINGLRSDTNDSRYFSEALSFIKQPDGEINIPKNTVFWSGLVNTLSDKVSSNTVLMDIKFIANILKRESFAIHGFSGLGVETQNAMLDKMISATKDSKVLNSIVSLIPVDMMNVLSKKEISPQVLLHNKPMLLDALSGNGVFSGSVSSMSISDLIRIATLASAKVNGLQLGFTAENISAAISASNNDFITDKYTNASVRTEDIPAFRGSKIRWKNGSANWFFTGETSTIDNRHGITPNSDVALDMDSASTLSISPIISKNVQAFYHPSLDVVFFIAENISKNKDLKSLLLHEISVHALKMGKTDSEFQALLTRFEQMKKTNPKVKEAFARVPKDTNPEHVTEEALAYLLEYHSETSLGQKIIQAFRKLLRSIGKALPMGERLKWVQWANNLSEGDLISMATSVLHSAPDSLMFDGDVTGSSRATGNNGDFSSENNDIRYSRASEDEKSILDSLVAERVSLNKQVKKVEMYSPEYVALQKKINELNEKINDLIQEDHPQAKISGSDFNHKMKNDEKLDADMLEAANFHARGRGGKRSVIGFAGGITPHSFRNIIANYVLAIGESDSLNQKTWVLIDTILGNKKYSVNDVMTIVKSLLNMNAIKNGESESLRQYYDKFNNHNYLNKIINVAKENMWYADGKEKALAIIDYIEKNYSTPHGASSPSANRTTPPVLPANNNSRNSTTVTTQSSALDTSIYTGQNKFIDLKNRMKEVVKNGGVIKEYEDAYMAEELYHKRLAQRQDDFLKEEMNPILVDLHDADIDIDDFQKFLLAKHAPSRNKVMAERNPSQAIIDQTIADLTDDIDQLEAQTAPLTTDQKKELKELNKELDRWNGAQAFNGTEDERLSLSGMSDREANSIINGKDSTLLPKYEAIAAKIYALEKKTLALSVSYQLETQGKIDELDAMWDFYIPTHRDEAHPDSNSHSTGNGFSVRGSSFKNATGSNAEVTNILAHIAMARESVLTRGEKNRVSLIMANFLLSHPDDDFATVNKVPTETVLRNGFAETRIDPDYKSNKNVVIFRAKGKDVAMEFNERNDNAFRLAMALKNIDGSELYLIEKIVGMGTRAQASVNTQFNLAFGVLNLLRDVPGGLINLSSTPLAGKQAAVFKEVIPAMIAIYGAERGIGSNNSPMKQLYKEFGLAGATTGFRDLFVDVKGRQKHIENEFKRLSKDGGVIKKSVKTMSYLFEWLSDFNTAMENAVRLASYKVAKDNGLSVDKSASIAKNITVNFNRKGAATPHIGAGYAFFNASMQGTARMIETLQSPAGKKIMASGVALGALSTLVGILAMGDDDWEKIPEHVRERSLIIPDFANRGNYFAVPMPLGFHVIPNIGRKAVEAAMGSKRISKTQRFADLLLTAINSFNPLGGSDIGQTITPTVADPIVALWRNKDWTGRSIYQDNFNSLDPSPGFSRTKNTATWASKETSKLINKATGGTDAQPGHWSPTPDQIDYLFGQLTGGTGREISKIEQIIESRVSGEDVPMYKIPVLGKLYGETSGGAAESGIYYDNVKKLNGHKREIDYWKDKPGGGRKVIEYLRDNPEARLLDRVKPIEKEIADLKKRKKEMEAKGANKFFIKNINSKIQASMLKLNNRMDAVNR